MNVKVVKPFRDKETGTIRKVGEVFEATEERCAEILKVGKFIQLEESNGEAMAEEAKDKPKRKSNKK